MERLIEIRTKTAILMITPKIVTLLIGIIFSYLFPPIPSQNLNNLLTMTLWFFIALDLYKQNVNFLTKKTRWERPRLIIFNHRIDTDLLSRVFTVTCMVFFTLTLFVCVVFYLLDKYF